jgi:hypothetical protein
LHSQSFFITCLIPLHFQRFGVRIFCRLGQLLSFPLHLFASFPWNASITGWFQWLCAYVTIPGYFDSGAGAAVDLFYVVITLLVLLLLGVSGLAYSLAVHQYAPLWPLQTLRKLMSLLTSVLFIPGLVWFQTPL